jgi:hypothetical protein
VYFVYDRPFKYLWNVLEGNSVIADDEVLLHELRMSYPFICQGLLLFTSGAEPSLGEAIADGSLGSFVEVPGFTDFVKQLAKVMVRR